MSDIYTAGAARVTDPDGSNILPVVRTQLQVDPDTDDAEDYGEIPLMPGLGITALPAAPDDDGHAELACIEGCGGFTAVCVGGRDARCKDVVAQLQPGEVALHSIGTVASKRSRVFCKEDLLALLIGNDCAVVVDRGHKYLVANIPEAGQIELSKANGFLAGDSSGAGFQIKGGKILLNAGEVSIPGGLRAGGASAQPLIKSTALLSYFTALEALLQTIAAATSPPQTAAVAAFSSAMASVKTAMVALFANAE